jgi:hypothetical protein
LRIGLTRASAGGHRAIDGAVAPPTRWHRGPGRVTPFTDPRHWRSMLAHSCILSPPLVVST